MRYMLRKTEIHYLVVICLAVIFGLVACGEKAPPASNSQVVKKKIGDQKKKVAPAVKTTKSEPKAAEGAAPADSTAAEKSKKPNVSKLVEESMAAASTYDPKGRFDPFEPLLKDDPEKGVTTSKGRKKRIPQTPLERVAISQLKLSAIMRTSKGNSAIVEDATGKGYVVRKGTYIGLNSGQVTKISKTSVMIEEEIEDVSGEFRIQNIELKLQKPAGEL